MALSLMQVVPAPAQATSEAFTGSSAVNGTYGTSTAVTDLQVSGTGNDTISVRLFVSHGSLSMSTVTGLTFTGSSSGSPLQFSGTRSDINTALATLSYQASQPGADAIEASLVGPGEIYYPANGHLYEVVTSTLSWTAAQAAAAARTKYGAAGYLTTITSAEENAFVAARLNNAGWMGASDVATEGDWKWVTGPETGTSFWSGLSTGSAVSGRYANWSTGEPNDSGSNEDCAQFLAGSTGMWNDLPCTGTTLPRYVVEYGTPGTLPAIQSKNITITTGTSTRNISSCSQLQDIANLPSSQYDTFVLSADINCSSITNFAPIGSVGTDWTVFRGTFDGNGHSISGLTINDPNTNAGLFQQANAASFHDLTLASGSVTSVGTNAGALVGLADGVVFANITSHVNVTGGSNLAGGIAGSYNMTAQDITITNVRSDGVITASSSHDEVGGLFGSVELYNGAELTISRSAFTGSVTGRDYVGGLVGWFNATENGDTGLSILDSYTAATIGGRIDVGGLVGLAEPSVNTGNTAGLGYLTIRRSYTNSAVTSSSNHAAGLIGYVDALTTAGQTLTITDSFAASSLASASDSRSLFYMGGSVTAGTLTINDLYVDDLRSGTASWANVATTGVVGVNTSGNLQPNYFFHTTTQEPLDEWDFASGNVWFAHPAAFPTHEPGVDDDEDGIPGANEDGGPNGGDSNNDGILDSRQSNVASFINGFTGKTVATELSGACQLTSLAMRSEALLGTPDGGYDYPQGLVRFTADCGTPGYTANVKLYFYNVSKDDLVLRKSNPVRNAYYAMPNSVVSQLTIGGTTVTRASYEVTDGALLDEDATANGTIIDPAGLALGVVAAPNTGLGGANRK